MNITERIDQVLARFNSHAEWEDKYRELIKMGKSLSVLDDADKKEMFRIKGCQSQVWLKPSYTEGKLFLHADSDAILVKGIIGLLVEIYSGEAPEIVLNTPPTFLKDIGITDHLSMNRTNGLSSMVKQIHVYAGAFAALKAKGINHADL